MALYEEDEDYDLDGEESVMLDEELDENYEPTDEEIIEYAQFLGMDLNEDQDLIYIAKEGLKAPLPENYKPYRRRTGEIVYIDLRTNEFQEEHPCDEYYKNLYHEMKRKKTNKQTGSKFKKNFPLGNKATPPKTEVISNVQTSSGQKKVAEKNILDKSIGSDHHDSLTSSLHDTSFNQMPGPLINKDKKKSFGSNLQTSDMKASIGASEPEGAVDDIDQEYEDKFFDHYKQQEQEFNASKKRLKEKEESHELNLKRKLEKEKQEIKDKLKADNQANMSKLEKEKQILRKELEKEWDANVEKEIKALDKQHFTNKRELDKNQGKDLEEDLAEEQEKIEREYQKKKENLIQKKQELQQEIDHIKTLEKEKELKDSQNFDKEKEEIIARFSNQLRESEVQERVRHESEIQQYQKEIKNKLEEEKKMLAIAKNQKQTLVASQKEELKEYYERKLISEQEKLDIKLGEDLKTYEELERTRKNAEAQKAFQAEIKQQRDKKQLQYQNEIRQLEDNYKKRLANYQQILKEKYEKEIGVIDEEYNKSIEDSQRQINNIKLDISSHEEILKEIKRVQSNDSLLTQQIKDYELKIEKLKEENSQLQKKLGGIKTNQKNIKQSTNKTVENLKQEIKEKDKEIERLWRGKKALKDQYYHPIQKISSKHKVNISDHNGNTSLNTIIKDLKEIKSFITPKEEEKSHSYIRGLRNDSTKLYSRNFLNSHLSDKKESFSRKPRHFKHIEDWDGIYHDELEKVEVQKRQLKKDKIALKKAQEYLQEEQEKYKEGYSDFRVSPNKSFERKSMLKKTKISLNDQVKRLNDDVYKLRETELLLRNKEKLLENMGIMIQKLPLRDFDTEEIENLFKQYQELDLAIQNLSKQTKTTDPIFSTEETQGFYKRWESILENQLSLDVDSSLEDTKILQEKKPPQHNYSEMMDKLPRYEIREETSLDLKDPKSTKNADYSYQNLIQILDLKLKTDLKIPENDYARRQRHQSTEHRYKMNAAFSEHSEWLKGMKTQLNKQLYERPQSASTLVASRF